MDGVEKIGANHELALNQLTSPQTSTKDLGTNVNSATKATYVDHSPIVEAKLTLDNYNKGK